MLIHFSPNRFQQFKGIFFYNRKAIFIFLIVSLIAHVLYVHVGFERIALPLAPVSIIGVGLAIFLGFRNSSAYDRWWEARKIWGGIVNVSRMIGMEITSFIQNEDQSALKEDHQQIIYRHIAWLYALSMHLRKQDSLDTIQPLLSQTEHDMAKTFKNIPSQLINLQSKHIEQVYRKGHLTDFSHNMLNGKLEELYTLQGKAERIKNTVFPYYYNYFTRVFLWLFLIILPFALIDKMGWEAVPLSTAISFVFYILDKSGTITEDPFAARAADTPMTALCRTIEIDLRQMLGEKDLPEPAPIKYSVFGVAYLD